MAVTLLEAPVQDNGTFVCEWLSAYHPIVFKLNGEPPIEGRSDYAIQVAVYELGSNTKLGETGLLRPYGSQPLDVNISGFILPYLQKYEQPLELNQAVNNDVLSDSLRFRIEVRDRWMNTSDNSITENNYQAVGQSYYAVLYEPGIGNRNGQWLTDYIPYPDKDPLSSFLTEFEELVYFEGFPFVLSMIFPVELSEIELQIEEDQIRRDFPTVPRKTYRGLNETGVGKVNHLSLSEGYPSNVDDLIFSLQTGQSVDIDYYEEGYIEEGYID